MSDLIYNNPLLELDELNFFLTMFDSLKYRYGMSYIPMYVNEYHG